MRVYVQVCCAAKQVHNKRMIAAKIAGKTAASAALDALGERDSRRGRGASGGAPSRIQGALVHEVDRHQIVLI